MPAMQLPHLMMLGAHALVAAGRRDEALARYDEALAQAAPVDVRSFSFHRDLAHAHFALEARRHGRGERDAAHAVRGLPRGRVLRLHAPDAARRVEARSRSRSSSGIEPDYVRTLVRLRGLPPPSPDLADWPWPLAIRTLGAFEILRDGEPLVSKGKAQKKPLELLKALVAHGGAARRRHDADVAPLARRRGRRRQDVVRQHALPAAQAPRRRRRDRALRRQALARSGERVGRRVGVRRALDDDTAPSTRRSRSHRGHFLADEASLPWALPDARPAEGAAAARRRRRSRDLRGERRLRRPRARSTRRRSSVDNLAEAVYRRLMVCQRELGDAAGAMSTYRRCRELLSIVLGRTPAAETEAVRRTLAG